MMPFCLWKYYTSHNIHKIYKEYTNTHSHNAATHTAQIKIRQLDFIGRNKTRANLRILSSTIRTLDEKINKEAAFTVNVFLYIYIYTHIHTYSIYMLLWCTRNIFAVLCRYDIHPRLPAQKYYKKRVSVYNTHVLLVFVFRKSNKTIKIWKPSSQLITAHSQAEPSISSN